MSRRGVLAALALVVVIGASPMLAPTAASAGADPILLPLPNGFEPEGIALGRGTTFFVGSLANGAIYRGDTGTGEGDLLVAESTHGGPAVGLSFDRATDRLFVAGGGAGVAVVVDTESGDEIASVPLTTEPSFVNDVVIAKGVAWFTDSRRPVLYRMPVDDPASAEEVALDGEFGFDPAGFNLNGIAALRGGRVLVVVHSPTGRLFRVDPGSGEIRPIDLGSDAVVNGDGLVVKGRDLVVVQNRDNQLSIVRLSRDLSSGSITEVIEDPSFRIPTTAARRGQNLFVVNARFGTPPGPDVDYDVVRVRI